MSIQTFICTHECTSLRIRIYYNLSIKFLFVYDNELAKDSDGMQYVFMFLVSISIKKENCCICCNIQNTQQQEKKIKLNT